jgi:hypothetical protein
MKPLPLLAVLLAVMIAGCSKSDPYAKYRDVQLKRGMKIADIKQQFGEPDRFDEWWNKYPSVTKFIDPKNSYLPNHSNQQSPEYPHHVQELNFGAFGAHDQKKGHITKHRLSMTFVDGELYEWEKSTPIDRE